MSNTIERDKLVARAINEMRRMINIIQTVEVITITEVEKWPTKKN